MDQCGKQLPELEAIKSRGWNLMRAEAQGTGAAGKQYKYDHDLRLSCLRDWTTWLSNPYDEQRGLSGVPLERRGRHYWLSSIFDDEFPLPALDKWPKWTRIELIGMYLSRYGKRPESKAMPMKVEPSVASGTTGK